MMDPVLVLTKAFEVEFKDGAPPESPIIEILSNAYQTVILTKDGNVFAISHN